MESYDAYEKFYSDKEASTMYGGPLKKEQIWARLKSDLGSWYLLGFGVWVIKSKLDGSLIGVCGFWQGKDWPKELTWWILPEYRGQGIATESSKAAIEYAYKTFKWDAVETYMADENIAARALVQKLGEQKIRRHKFNDELYRDVFKIPAG